MVGTRKRSLWLATLTLAFGVVLTGTLAVGASAGGTESSCATVEQYSLEKQTNVHAAQILASCGRGEAGGFALHEFSALRRLGATAPELGGVDRDVTAGAGDVLPHITQSETQTWAEGNTTVVTYNDSKTAPSCYSGGSVLAGQRHQLGLSQLAAVLHRTRNRLRRPRRRVRPGPRHLDRGLPRIGLRRPGSRRLEVCRRRYLDDRRLCRTTARVTTASPAGSTTTRRARSTDASTSRGTTSRRRQNIYSIFSNDGGATWSAPVQRADRRFHPQRAGHNRRRRFGHGLHRRHERGRRRRQPAHEPRLPLDERRRVVLPRSPWAPRSRLRESRTAARTRTSAACSARRPPATGATWAGATSAPARAASSTTRTRRTARAADAGDIYYTRSTDNGLTWSPGVKIDGDGSARSQWMPSLSVAPTGHVLISWYDARNTTGDDLERWGRTSSDNGATWANAEVISDVVSPKPSAAGPERPGLLRRRLRPELQQHREPLHVLGRRPRPDRRLVAAERVLRQGRGRATASAATTTAASAASASATSASATSATSASAATAASASGPTAGPLSRAERDRPEAEHGEGTDPGTALPRRHDAQGSLPARRPCARPEPTGRRSTARQLQGQPAGRTQVGSNQDE